MAWVLLAGEKEELRLHPSVPGWRRHYARTLPFAVIGLALYALTWLPAWQNHSPNGPFWSWLWGTPEALFIYLQLALTALGLASWLFRRRFDHLLLATGVGWVAIGWPLFTHAPAESAPLLTALATPVGLVWAEVRRATTTYHITNLRTAKRTVFPPSFQSIHHTDLMDVDAKPILGTQSAHLLLLGHDRNVNLVGIPHAPEVREILALLTQRATATEYLRKTQELDARLLDALARMNR